MVQIHSPDQFKTGEFPHFVEISPARSGTGMTPQVQIHQLQPLFQARIRAFPLVVENTEAG